MQADHASLARKLVLLKNNFRWSAKVDKSNEPVNYRSNNQKINIHLGSKTLSKKQKQNEKNKKKKLNSVSAYNDTIKTKQYIIH